MPHARLSCLWLLVLLPWPCTAEEMSFERAIAPILERRCVGCHNDQDSKGGLSLQSAAGFRAGGDGGAAVVAGDPAGSLLLEYVSGDKPEMPKEGPPLSAAEVESLRQWIADGAPWPDELQLHDKSLADFSWWSLQPVVRPRLPQLDVPKSQLVHSPIDYFLLEKLDEQGLSFAPEADRRTLIRRLYFDLLGLPPRPEEVTAFIADESPTAYEQLVDRLLASPHYGERWARHWLDVVKYADTCGYDKDKLRPHAWPYRDYTVRAFNEDKPYAQFVQEQIAGDVLFPGTPDGILGLGFIAAGPWDFIGHVEVPESKIDGQVARNIDRDEMVTNTLNTFCSVTIQCARCHNHKFDPFTQRHYYGLQAIFAAVDRAERPYDLDPEVEHRRYELEQRQRQLTSERAQLDSLIVREGGEELAAVERRIGELQPRATPRDKHPAFGYHSQIEPTPDREKWVQIDLGRQVPIRKVVLHPCHDEFAGIGAGFGFPTRFQIRAGREAAPGASADATWETLSDQSTADFPNPGLAPWAIDVVVSARYLRVTATRLTERQQDFIFALAEVEVIDEAGQNVALQAAVTSLDSIEAPVRWSRSNLTDGIWAQSADEAALQELATAQARRVELLTRINTPERTALRERLQQESAALANELRSLPQGKLVYAAATRFAPQGNFQPTAGKPRAVRLLHRGNVTDPREEVHPGVIPLRTDDAFELNLPAGHSEGERRAALANWLTRPEHPLAWRSIVNRIWQYHFGRGLVDSPNDFGRMGQLPSHPALLDWLAAEFRDNGQSVKQLHRLIVTSAAYRQSVSSSHANHASAIDANNRLLWHMNRRRLEAEELRDAILVVSGRMHDRMGGPGFYLFVLEKTDHSPHYEYHLFDPADVGSHRRSIYRFVVRSQPDPYMTTLDCADSSQSTPQRGETQTALQALSLLNNKFQLVMSEHFARRLRTEADSVGAQVDLAMQLIAGRWPTAEERQQLADYASRHGLENLCRVLFNLSEFVFVE